MFKFLWDFFARHTVPPWLMTCLSAVTTASAIHLLRLRIYDMSTLEWIISMVCGYSAWMAIQYPE